MKKHILDAGKLRFRCDLFTRTVTIEHGISKENWTQAAACWCNAQPLSGREFWEAAALNRENELRFTIRYRKGLSLPLRIKMDSVLYEITEIIDPENRHVRLELLGKAVNAGG